MPGDSAGDENYQRRNDSALPPIRPSPGQREALHGRWNRLERVGKFQVHHSILTVWRISFRHNEERATLDDSGGSDTQGIGPSSGHQKPAKVEPETPGAA